MHCSTPVWPQDVSLNYCTFLIDVKCLHKDRMLKLNHPAEPGLFFSVESSGMFVALKVERNLKVLFFVFQNISVFPGVSMTFESRCVFLLKIRFLMENWSHRDIKNKNKKRNTKATFCVFTVLTMRFFRWRPLPPFCTVVCFPGEKQTKKTCFLA